MAVGRLNEVDLATDHNLPSLLIAEKAKEALKQKLAEVSKAAQNTVTNLTGSLPTAPIVQSLLKISATTDVAMTDRLRNLRNQDSCIIGILCE